MLVNMLFQLGENIGVTFLGKWSFVWPKSADFAVFADCDLSPTQNPLILAAKPAVFILQS